MINAMKSCLMALIVSIGLLNAPFVSANPFSVMGITPVTQKVLAPGFSLDNLNGDNASLVDYTGEVILLNFWATWCMPCRQEMPAMERLWQRYKNKGLVVLGVSNDDAEKRRRVATFVKKVDLSFPILLDTKSLVSDLYGVSGIPVSYLISRDGIVLAKIVGTREWDSQDAFSLVENLLKK